MSGNADMNPRATSVIASRPTAGSSSFGAKRSLGREERRNGRGVLAAPGGGISQGEVVMPIRLERHRRTSL
jgi:hypothetical protein